MEPAVAPSPEVRYLSADDLRVAASLLLQAYRDDPFFRSVFPADNYEQRLRAAIREELHELWQREQIFVGLELEGALVGVASLLDGAYPLGQERFWNWRLKMALGTGWSGARQWMAREQEILERLDFDRTHLLQFVAVAPAYRRRGYGAQLLSSVIALERERHINGLATMIYWPTLKPLFESLGFNPIAELNVGQVTGSLYQADLR
ncbi:GNAT family N-acetyltransferase [Ferrimonas gelatinilytica]|uniref:GNAT family N-acetyltransferase n=1 Tax=Ferrimonas gelatinilytica TaxID=1255257 RepID=A0ABP9S2G8_9GAMM